MEEKTKAIIIGGGPAGLTAAYELATRTNITPLVIEKSGVLGGISRTVFYKGNRMDVGGHRFFSKSDRVMKWWLNILPIQKLEEKTLISPTLLPEGYSRESAPDPEQTDEVMLLRRRRSRIYCFRKFFDYPISLSLGTMANLGFSRTVKIGLSYLKSVFFPIKNETKLEEFFINRFGRELYLTFFKSYTEKVWGTPCSEISASWGAQRVKGLSVWKSLVHILKKIIPAKKDISAKGTETSLIEQFLYPKFGPGQMWEKVAQLVCENGGEILLNHEVVGIYTEHNRVTGIRVTDTKTGNSKIIKGDFYFSTMPVKDLIRGLEPKAPENVQEISEGLVYRDFFTVGLLLEELKIKPESKTAGNLINDTWIYIQEPDVDVGRLQVFNNWSPYMVSDPGKVWIGLEYFCFENEGIWNKTDEELIQYAKEEISKIGIIEKQKVLDGCVIRMPKTYPAYFGTYSRFGEIRSFLDQFENLFLVGRNGMHRYNNQDHSMLSAMVAVDNILEGKRDKSAIWEVNTEQEYHESRKE